MAYCDFVIRYDPEKDSKADVSKRILYTLFVKRLKANKPVICFLGGDSGEGKSTAAVKIQEVLMEAQGVDIKKCFNEMNVYTPIEYPEKIKKLLFPKGRFGKDLEKEKAVKKCNVIAMHEAREVVKAKNWHSFLTQSVADVNAMSRSVKRLCIIIISQFIRDITNDIRYTLTYYMKVSRPLRKATRLYINVMWKDDSNLEKPALKKRKLSGYLVYPGNRYKRYVPKYLELTLPNKELVEMFEKQDFDAKAGIIKRKLDKMVKEMSIEMEEGTKKVDTMVTYYTEDISRLNTIGKRNRRNKWKLKPQAREMHELNDIEVKDFETKLNKKLEEGGFIQDENGQLE